MEKKQRKIIRYLINSLIILGIVILCSIFGIIFLADSIPNAVRVIFGIVISLTTLLAVFMYGRSVGDTDYKKLIQKQTGRSNSFSTQKFEIMPCILSFLAFFGVYFVLTLVGIIFKIAPIVGIVTITFLPFALIFTTVIISDAVSLVVFAVYLPYLFLICGSFVAGYIYKINQIKKMRRDIASELRMFNN